MASSTDSLIHQALTGNVDVGVLERLIALKEREDARKAEAALIQALHDFQEKCPAVVKTITVKTNSGTPAYKFAPYHVVKKTITPALMQCGLMFSHTVEEKRVVCRVSHRDGAFVESSFPLTTWEGTQMQNSTQKMASSISYAKRYSLLGALGIATTDDDDAGSVDDPTTLDELKRLYGAWFAKSGMKGRDKSEAWAAWTAWCKDRIFSREITDDEIRNHVNWTQRDVQRGHEFLGRVSFDDFAPQTVPTVVQLMDEINTSDDPEHIRRQLVTAETHRANYGEEYETIVKAGNAALKKLADFNLKG